MLEKLAAERTILLVEHKMKMILGLSDRILVLHHGRLIADGTITGGMIPKVETCIYAIEQGVEAVVILNGKVAHAALLELFTDFGAGTLIRRT